MVERRFSMNDVDLKRPMVTRQTMTRYLPRYRSSFCLDTYSLHRQTCQTASSRYFADRHNVEVFLKPEGVSKSIQTPILGD